MHKKSRSLTPFQCTGQKFRFSALAALPSHSHTHSVCRGQCTALGPIFYPGGVHSPTTEVRVEQVFPDQRHFGALLSTIFPILYDPGELGFNFPLGWWICCLDYIPIYPDCQWVYCKKVGNFPQGSILRGFEDPAHHKQYERELRYGCFDRSGRTAENPPR